MEGPKFRWYEETLQQYWKAATAEGGIAPPNKMNLANQDTDDYIKNAAAKYSPRTKRTTNPTKNIYK